MKKKESKPKISRLTAFQRAMIQIAKETNFGSIPMPDESKRFYEILLNELSKDLITIRQESKITFFKGILIGASFGILGNFFITTMFRLLDKYTIIRACLSIRIFQRFFH